MPVDCQRSTCGGKGNYGMFIKRSPNLCAAGLPTAQPDDHVKDSLQHYLLKDEADSLISDAIIPADKTRPLPPLHHPIQPDKRNAGLFCDVAEIVNPPNKTKFQSLTDDLKDTAYSSYWKRPLGCVHDSVPMLPEGFDVFGITFGRRTPFHGRLYDIVMPKNPYPDKTPPSKRPGEQRKYNYCKPSFDSDLTYGHRTYVDKRGSYVKCCLTDNKVFEGTGNRTIVNSIQANFLDTKQSRIGIVSAPNENIKNVPKDFCFGKLKPPDNLPECLTLCELNPGRDHFHKCLKHLNTLRKSLSTRFLPTFFNGFYLNLKHFNKDKSGWLPKEVVYNYCGTKLIRFDPTLIEPLLSLWQAFDGTRIEYKIFVNVINYREPFPEIPKIPDLQKHCLNFNTTYTKMVKTGQKADQRPMAGLPSGRYLDLDYPISPEKCCKADTICLPHESDMKSCLSPSVLTFLHVNHRDMYAKREPHVVKRVFEATGEKFCDDTFNAIWKNAKKYHSQGWVCYETFRRALEAYLKSENEENKIN
ncbi:EF-hand domain-containing family member B-like [Galleria mellonella]|uniref:EF-hand domain-containing family member B-like n=1 Tax=Galleria mellonella TaxID=7137 RepID=A0A6J1X1Q1_GALME|nr:EF-hand domain-containing family member B-like [Galleria mellonella]